MKRKHILTWCFVSLKNIIFFDCSIKILQRVPPLNMLLL